MLAQIHSISDSHFLVFFQFLLDYAVNEFMPNRRVLLLHGCLNLLLLQQLFTPDVFRAFFHFLPVSKFHLAKLVEMLELLHLLQIFNEPLDAALVNLRVRRAKRSGHSQFQFIINLILPKYLELPNNELVDGNEGLLFETNG